VRLASILLASLLIAPGCASERASPECKEVCRKDARCADQKAEAAAGRTLPAGEQAKFDQSECIEVCTALRRDPEGEKRVAEHLACVARAGEDCAALLACP
jgi:hypothetical protein